MGGFGSPKFRLLCELKMSRKRLVAISTGVLLLPLFAASLRAQDYRARLQGIVSDPTQSVVAGAKVTLTNLNTGISAVKNTGPEGHYVFDLVEPGTYTVTVESIGFQSFQRDGIVVQVRADVTVDAMLAVGNVSDQVIVNDRISDLQFNTSTMDLTVDHKMLTDLPILARNPFTLALLDPAVVNRYWTDRNPFYMWSSNDIDVGGSTAGKNDLLLDGAPLMMTNKGSYAPPMDAVQEFTVQQNSVDAEYGNSADRVLSLSLKSGTNEFHGTAYYFGLNPALNAVANAVTHQPNQVRNHIWGEHWAIRSKETSCSRSWGASSGTHLSGTRSGFSLSRRLSGLVLTLQRDVSLFGAELPCNARGVGAQDLRLLSSRPWRRLPNEQTPQEEIRKNEKAENPARACGFGSRSTRKSWIIPCGISKDGGWM